MESSLDLKNDNQERGQNPTEGEENAFMCLIIQDFNNAYIRYDIISSNIVYGIRHFLLEIPHLSYITNYDLVVAKSGKKLEDYESLYEGGLEEYDVVKMVPTIYNASAVDYHISRLNYILEEQAPFINKTSNTGDIISRDLNKLIEKSKEYFNSMNEVREKYFKDKGQEGDADKAEKSEKTEQTDKKESKEASKQIPKENQKENTKETAKDPQKEAQSKNEKIEEAINNMNKTKDKIAEMEFKKFSLVNYSDSVLYEDLPKPQKYKCVNSMLESKYNSKVQEYSQYGDLKYIEISTLEDKLINITCSERGFFLNNSTPEKFENSPSQHPCYSQTLPGLLCQISPLFRENFSKLISQVILGEPILFLPTSSDKFEWLKTVNKDESTYSYRYINFPNDKENMKYIKLNKEWNEEFQALVDLEHGGELIKNMTKEKLLQDFYLLFKETAIEGTKLIRSKKLIPFNFLDNPRASSGYYLYGNVFLTELKDTYMDFRTFTKEELKQTYLGSNLDLRHINYLNSNKHSMSLNDFYFSLNCIVEYKGVRVHAQVITPGVIFNSQHLVQYGEVDEGVVKFSESFHEDYKKFCDKLNIREVTVTDYEGNNHKFMGNPEIKGVVGVDKRKYLFDLVHLMPKDLNFSDVDDNGCLIRPELLKEYQYKLIYNKMMSDYGEETKKINEELSQNNLSRMMKEPNTYVKYVEERTKRKEEIFEKVKSEIKQLWTLDTSIGYNDEKIKITNEKYEEDEKVLRDIAKFLKEDVLVKVLSELAKNEESSPNDCFSFTSYLHKYGISVKYYGAIIKLLNETGNEQIKKAQSWIKSLILRDVIRRCAKHVYNNLAASVPDHLIKDFCAYFLNILFAPTSCVQAIENLEVNYLNGNIILEKQTKEKQGSQATTNVQTQEKKEKETSKKKKNRNKKKKKKEGKKDELEQEIGLLVGESLINKELNAINEVKEEDIKKYFIKPSQLWEEIRKIASKRYSYSLDEKKNFDYIESSVNKFGLLRDFCLTVGLQIQAQDYEIFFDYSPNRLDLVKYSQMPFQKENMVDFFTKVKDYQMSSDLHRPIFEQAETLLKGGNIMEGIEKLKQTVYVCNEIYGQINQYSGLAHKKLGEIYYSEGDYMNAIVMTQKAIIIFEKLYDYDTNAVANAYFDLSTYYHFIGQDLEAFKYISRSLEIMNVTYPKNHPELVNRICNLTIYFVDVGLEENAKELIESFAKGLTAFFAEDDKNLQKIWLIISQLNLKTFNLKGAMSNYEKYLGVIKMHVKDQNVAKNGDNVLQGLKTLADEIKKKQNIIKNRDDLRRVFEELCKKYVSKLFWDDLEKPLHKMFLDPNENAYINYILKKGFQNLQAEGKKETQAKESK